MNRQAIATELIAARKRAGLTQVEVAERIVLGFGDQSELEPREERARRVKRALAGYRFNPWERDPTPAEQRSLVADGLTRERFEREATAR